MADEKGRRSGDRIVEMGNLVRGGQMKKMTFWPFGWLTDWS